VLRWNVGTVAILGSVKLQPLTVFGSQGC
jgi:hypothetical protein